MAIADEIQSARECGIIRCGLSSQVLPSVSNLADEFGLSRDPCVYREIDGTAARRILQVILNQDLAYDSEIIPLSLATELADRFLNQFGTNGVRFYTNGTFQELRGPSVNQSLAGWNPATPATFDTGVLVIGPTCSGCLWVEDDD